MSPFHPGPEALPEEVAVFPLPGALLLPHGRLPLNIFEPRYLAMVLDSLAHGRMFGMVQPDTSTQLVTQGRNDPPALFRIGCLGRITSFAETEDGRLLITLVGVTRFNVVRELPSRRGYRRIHVDYASWLNDLSTVTPPPLDRNRVLEALKPYFRARRIEVNWEAIEQVPDSLLVTTLAMVCPFDPREKQALLEANSPEDRTEVLVALLQMEALGDPDNQGLPS